MHVLQSLSMIGVLAISAAAAAVPDDPHNVTPIDVNSAAPKFVAKEVDGRAFQFDPASLRQPTLIIFYRGGWCPYCNAQLQDLHTVVPQIVAMGYQVLFLSTDQPRLLYSSLKEKVDYHLPVRFVDGRGARLWGRLPRRCGDPCENEDVWNRSRGDARDYQA